MSYDEIRYALDDKLKTWADAKPIAVEWDNTARLDLADADQFLTTSFLPARPLVATVGLNGKNRRAGVYSINIRGHLGNGSGPLLSIADEIVSEFDRVDLTQGATTVRARSAWPTAAFIDGDFYVIPVSVSWFSFT